MYIESMGQWMDGYALSLHQLLGVQNKIVTFYLIIKTAQRILKACINDGTTSPTSGGRSVSIVLSRTKATEV
jgi:hypothetical protein